MVESCEAYLHFGRYLMFQAAGIGIMAVVNLYWIWALSSVWKHLPENPDA